MKIPVFHDDQHGTAIIVGAAVLQRAASSPASRSSEVKIVASGAGAAALACLNLLVSLGAGARTSVVTDIEGVVYEGRAELMDRWKSAYARRRPTSARSPR